MYRIEKNNCRCHPETCSCSSYNILRGNKVIARGNDFKELLDLLPVGNVPPANACPQLCEVRELIKKIEEWQDVVPTFELELMGQDTINVMTDIIRLKNSIKEKL